MESQIIAFPLHRRRKLVANLASILRSKHGHEATLFWRDTAKTLLRQLSSAGIAIENAEDQVRRLLYAVVAEIETDTIEGRG